MAEDWQVRLIRDPKFKALAPDRQKAVYDEAKRRFGGQTAIPAEPPSPTVSEQMTDSLLALPGIGEGVSALSKAGTATMEGLATSDAAMREGLRALVGKTRTNPAEAFARGAVHPESSPTFQSQLVNQATPRTASTLRNFMGGLGPSAAGLAMDTATSPAAWLASLLPAAPAGGGRTVAQALLSTPAVQALERVGTQPLTLQSIVGEVGKAGAGGGKALLEFLSGRVPFKGTVTQSIPRIFSTARGAEFAKSARGSLFKAKYDAGQAYVKAAEAVESTDPSVTTNLTNVFQEFKQALGSDPKTIADLSAGARRARNPLLLQVFENPDKAAALTGSQVRELKKSIDAIPAIAAKVRQGRMARWDPSDIPLVDLKHDIAQSQLATYPGFEEINQTYGTAMNQYKLLKSRFREGSLVQNILTNFGGDPEVLQALKTLLPPGMVNEMASLRGTARALRASKTLGKTLAITGTAGAAGKFGWDLFTQ